MAKKRKRKKERKRVGKNMKYIAEMFLENMYWRIFLGERDLCLTHEDIPKINPNRYHLGGTPFAKNT